MSFELDPLIERLRAAGEPTRLRILALLRRQDLSVGELVSVLSQSQPRLSHHLKGLAAAGLVERLPEGSFVFYRATTQGPAKIFLDGLFAQVDLSAAPFAHDADQLGAVTAARAQSADAYFSSIADTWDTVRSLHYPNDAIEAALLKLAGPQRLSRVVDFGTGTGRMLALFAPLADEAEGVDLSHGMLTVARANLQAQGISHARVRQGNVTATPFEDASADLVIIHQVLHYMDAPGQAIREAARILKPGGRLLVVDFAPHELEFLRTEHGHHRLGLRHDAMQLWARDAGLKLDKAVQFAPPSETQAGLTVNVWKAEKPARAKEKAA